MTEVIDEGIKNLKANFENGNFYNHFKRYGLKDNEVFLPSSLNVRYNAEKGEVVLNFDEIKRLALLLDEINVRRLKEGFVRIDNFSQRDVFDENFLKVYKPLLNPVGFGFETNGFLHFLIQKVDEVVKDD